MVEVDENSSISRCFNSTLTGAAATTPPCGIDLEHPESGEYNLNFNFEVDDRFYATQILYDSTLALAIYQNGTNGLQVLWYYPSETREVRVSTDRLLETVAEADGQGPGQVFLSSQSCLGEKGHGDTTAPWP